MTKYLGMTSSFNVNRCPSSHFSSLGIKKMSLGAKSGECCNNSNFNSIILAIETWECGGGRQLPRSGITGTNRPIARRIRVNRVGTDDGARSFCSFLVGLACENDTSNFSLFYSLPPCNAIFRFYAVCYRVEIENCIFLNSVQKRREADDNFEFTKYVVEEIILLFSIFLKNFDSMEITKLTSQAMW